MEQWSCLRCSYVRIPGTWWNMDVGRRGRNAREAYFVLNIRLLFVWKIATIGSPLAPFLFPSSPFLRSPFPLQQQQPPPPPPPLAVRSEVLVFTPCSSSSSFPLLPLFLRDAIGGGGERREREVAISKKPGFKR